MHKSPFSDFLLCQLPWANPSKLASVMKRWTIAGRQKRGTEGFLHLRYFALRYFHAKSEDGKTSKYVSFFLLRTWFWLESSRNWQDEELERQVKSRNWSWLPDSLMLLACKFWIIIALLLQSFALPNSSGKVNLKHLLWQLREQQSALSAVTELRQEAPWGQRTLRSAVVNVFSLRFFGHEISMCFVCFGTTARSSLSSCLTMQPRQTSNQRFVGRHGMSHETMAGTSNLPSWSFDAYEAVRQSSSQWRKTLKPFEKPSRRPDSCLDVVKILLICS